MRPWRNWQTRTFEGRMVNPVRVQVSVPVRVQVSVAAPQSQQRRFSRVPAPLRCGHFAFTPCCDFSAKEKCKAFAPLLVFSRCCKTIAPLIHFSFAVRRLAPPNGCRYILFSLEAGFVGVKAVPDFPPRGAARKRWRHRTETVDVFRCGAGRAQMKKRGGVPRFSLW